MSEALMINSEMADSLFLEIATLPADLDKHEFLNQIVQIIHNRLDLYFVGLYLVDFINRVVVLDSGSGAIGRKLVSLGHKAPVVKDRRSGWQAGTAIGLGEIRLTNWSKGETIGYALPPQSQVDFALTPQSRDEIAAGYSPILPLTRCELFLPLRVQEQVMGVLELHKSKESGFSEQDIKALQLLVDRIVVYVSRFFANLI